MNIKVLKIMKKIQIIFIVFTILQSVSILTTGHNVLADGSFFDNIIDSGKRFTEMGDESTDNSEIDIDEIWEPMLEIAKALTIVGFVVVTVRAMLLIPFLNGDSPKARKEAKQKLVEFIIIAALLAGAYKIWAFLLETLDQLATDSDLQ